MLDNNKFIINNKFLSILYIDLKNNSLLLESYFKSYYIFSNPSLTRSI